MRTRILQAGLPVFLSLTLLVGSMIPPAAQHAHADGHAPHTHGATETKDSGLSHHDHGHSHREHQHAHPHSDEAVPAQNPSSAPAPHQHLIFLWSDFCLPSRGGDGSRPTEKQGDPACEVLFMTHLRGGDFVETAACQLGPLAERLPPEECVSLPAAIARSQRDQAQLASLPLCDVARGARSGVQLT